MAPGQTGARYLAVNQLFLIYILNQLMPPLWMGSGLGLKQYKAPL